VATQDPARSRALDVPDKAERVHRYQRATVAEAQRLIASMGLPGLGNFVGEFLILRGVYAVSPTIAILAAIGLIPAALYSLIAIQRAFHGEAHATRQTHDFGTRETAMMLALGAAVIWLGIDPQPVLKMAAPSIAALLPITHAAAIPATRRGT
jgi:NADH-quinone oxidoreductase subunit M